MGTPQGGLRGPGTVAEGGNVRVEVMNGARSVQLVFLGQSAHNRRVPVIDGIVEFRVPPGVSGGSRILVSDFQFPTPSTIEVVVTGGSNQ
ncbi:MAG: hypothetical protein IT457_15380 [Planctomycetes bacterium]|nr:hypothetical protein [Planctomycetota bacterium]